MFCITFKKDGKLYFERESNILRIIPEDYAKKNTNEVMVWNGESDKQMLDYFVKAAHQRSIHMEKVEFTENEEVDLRTAKVTNVKDIPFLRAYYLQKYQDEVQKCYEIIKSLE